MTTSSEAGGYFDIGSVVKCTTCFDKEIEGEVLAFDPATKILALRTSAPSVSTRKTCIELVNLGLAKKVDLISESASYDPESLVLPSLNFDKIRKRGEEEVLRKKRTVSSANVTSEAQRLFMAITKTIDDVNWDRENIVIMKYVVVRPPYNLDNVELKEHLESNSQAQSAFQHVKKIVEKHLRENREKQNKQQSSLDNQKTVDSVTES